MKQRLAEKSVFFKKKLKFSTIRDYLDKDKVLNLVDGISEFIFMIELNNLGTVTTELKITNTGKFDLHVKQFHSYCKKLTKQEKEELDENENKTATKSSFYEMAAAMAAKGNPTPHGAEVDHTIAKWMNNLLRLAPLEVENWPSHVQDNILRVLRVYVFMMFYIEGIRNPAAFVIHPLVLHQLISQPLMKLDEYITEGKFIMTPKGSKEKGEKLQRFLNPDRSLNFFDEVREFIYQDMAVKEVLVVTEYNQKNNLELIENQILEMFNLTKK